MSEKFINLIDGGCTLLSGLKSRCEGLEAIAGRAKVFNHPEGVLVVHDDGWRVLIKLCAEERTP